LGQKWFVTVVVNIPLFDSDYSQLYIFCLYEYFVMFISGATNGENDYEAGLLEFDPVKHHNSYCPWVNGIVAAACCNNIGSSSSSSALSGWQLTIDALDTFHSLGQAQNQIMQSDSAASLYMVKLAHRVFFIVSKNQ